MYVILDLHWTAPGSVLANAQQPMPNTDHSVPFWSQAASHFKSMPNVIFDLFNEPYPDRTSGNDAWRCFKDGGSCPGINYNVAGYQTLVNTVRGTGAKNVVMIGGLSYSNDLSQWLNYRINDPLNQLAASTHIYNFNLCSYSSCWENQLFPVSQQVPLIVGEFGENDCQGGFVNALSQWFLGQGQYSHHGYQISHLAWTWNTWDCKNGPAVITNYDGTCTNNYGCTVKNLFENTPIVHSH
jgi:endoglucanase